MKKGNYRYHYVDDNNEVINVVVPKDSIIPENYIRGIYYKNPLLIKRRGQIISNIMKDVPKTEEQKEKMRLAKINKPKCESHKENMRKTHGLRCIRVKILMEYDSTLHFHQASEVEASWRKSVMNNKTEGIPQWYIDLLKEQNICQ